MIDGVKLAIVNGYLNTHVSLRHQFAQDIVEYVEELEQKNSQTIDEFDQKYNTYLQNEKDKK